MELRAIVGIQTCPRWTQGDLRHTPVHIHNRR